ncbi:unnamed protein product [Callosobruchus maculatus]|uniref:Uncharacterized protein n=1 Tax=Callosobruchus maculatus TaxID=64391 RepID=A0A653DL96_CALMS|nr:unnamed protein product [Callosobruchus maculatus]
MESIDFCSEVFPHHFLFKRGNNLFLRCKNKTVLPIFFRNENKSTNVMPRKPRYTQQKLHKRATCFHKLIHHTFSTLKIANLHICININYLHELGPSDFSPKHTPY